MLTHLYSLISRHLHIWRPTQMPSPLQSRTSNTSASHQHSTKFGKRWANAICKMITTIIIMYIYHRIKMCTAVSVTFTCKLHTTVHNSNRIWQYWHLTDLKYCITCANALKHNHAPQNSIHDNGSNSANLREFPHNTYSP